jgi:transposase InsO family protein
MALGLDKYLEFYHHYHPHAPLGNRNPEDWYLTPLKRKG